MHCFEDKAGPQFKNGYPLMLSQFGGLMQNG